MRLAISRRAAPDLPLSRFCELARARGLDGVELGERDLDDARALEAAAGFIVGIHVESPGAVASPVTARRAAELGAPVIAARGAVANDALAALDAIYRREGAELFVAHGTAVLEAVHLVDALDGAGASFVFPAWEIDTKRDDLREAPGVLLATSGALRSIRMRGGGPELSDEDGAGTGEVVSSIALSGYAGPLTIAPSTEDRVADWRLWLEGKGKTGCGTAHAKSKSRVRSVDLDIRPVEPRDRMETILGAYRALAPGRTLRVTFDHDPSCMFYTLQATEPEGSFDFERKDDGPEVWRANVTKRAS